MTADVTADVRAAQPPAVPDGRTRAPDPTETSDPTGTHDRPAVPWSTA
jgi:hypothetical protein